MSKRILVVDDEASIRFAVAEYFAAYGFEIDCADDAPAADLLLAGASYNAVVADLRLGDSDDVGGLHVIAAAHRKRPRPVIVLLSAYSSPQIEVHARRCGADAVLLKPMPLWELKSLLIQLMDAVAPRP